MSKKTLEQRVDALEEIAEVFKDFQEELHQYNESNFDKGLKETPIIALENVRVLLDILQKQMGGIKMIEERVEELEKKVENLEFKIQLLSQDTNTNRLLFEYNITHKQYQGIMDLMDNIRGEVEGGKEVSHGVFERNIYDIIGVSGDYHFCEFIAQAFMEDGRWEEVFPALYGGMSKYKTYMERRMREEE